MALELFRKSQEQSTGVYLVPNWDFIQRGFILNQNKVYDYYTTFKQSVRSNHLLVRLLENITIPKLITIERYHANVDYIALNISQMFGLTSVQSKGRLHRGVFYGINTPEFILTTDDYFNPEYVHNNWRRISAVKVLLHPKSDLNLQIPNGKDYSNENGLAIIQINIPMLAIQYRAYYLEQMMRTDSDSKMSIMQFIGTYVLPNMLNSHIDIALMNRIFNQFYDIPNNDFVKIKHPFALMDYTDQTDLAIDKMLENVNKIPKRFISILKSFHAFNEKSQYENLLMLDISPTRQVNWLLTLSRLKYFSLLIDICGKEHIGANMLYMNQAMRNLAMYDTYQMFKEILPMEVFFEYDAYVQNILDTVGKNGFR